MCQIPFLWHLELPGQYLKRTDPAFSPSAFGRSGLLDMIKTYDLLQLVQENGGHWSVSLAVREEAVPEVIN
ncbi:hypothetical protein D9M69_321830 [compost metagenome]